MSMREVISRLTTARNDLPRVRQTGALAQQSLNEAVRMVNSVLDDVRDKALAADIQKHAQAVDTACASAESAGPDLDHTIRNLRAVGGR